MSHATSKEHTPKAKRSSRRRTILLTTLLIASFSLVALGWPSLRQTLMVGTGYAAKRMCSEVFVADRSPEEIWRVDLSLLPTAILSYSLDRPHDRVTVSALGLVSQDAIFREGLGCSLTNGATLEEIAAIRLVRPAAPPRDPDTLWPLGAAPYEGTIEGLDRRALDDAIALAFEEPDLEDHPVQTRAVLVVYDGKLIAERYGEGFSKDTPLLSWSMAKSITNTMIGVLVHEGRLDVRSKAPLKMWQRSDDDDPRQAITIDDLMRMQSGLDFDETYGAFGDVTDMIFVEHSAASRAGESSLRAAPGTHWSYSSGDTNLLSQIVRDTIGDDARYHAFPSEKIFDKIGAHSAIFETDPSGTFVGSSFAYMTARDWARWGLLYLEDGVWQGERILPKGWRDYSCSLTSGTPLGEYGAQFWLNRGDPEGSTRRKLPSVPTDYCAAHGYETQRVAIVPSKKAIIVRLGLTPKRGTFPDDAFFSGVLDALP